ncbi:SWR1 complex bromodomain subunit bdf1 [Schizosaccharomyces pombe]|uniref:SWR1 complex bromodomain subunit bdf1 n=1 Tax=Schizosaccharomyces pombe (strain 972 / ATCC 24843) TaxID=284812 RepID=BDF1_SCHPO|nr:Swr1 complex bromodomain subunit Brf1 [Schizosaccharomyces pombe]Q9Y7N0.1 RecName: Full=SWR1 complex bromodomain subunit bdf1 [Schizosaccharomyces pombe 972h-]CAB41059.2 Swr1 complex bromodomain subunit Brf1 [Schizosaccharomyces pombe]|eukprot:NP_588301.2 Swr1 complex bromodomain subunit Brf1 [Schizosaccharomyces pombe]
MSSESRENEVKAETKDEIANDGSPQLNGDNNIQSSDGHNDENEESLSRKRDSSGATVGDLKQEEKESMPKKEPEPTVKKIRGSGMPPPQQKYCLAIVRQLKRTKNSAPFKVPVDPIKQNIPDYPTIVKNPMDLGTIEKKLTSYEYSVPQEFIDDMNLMFSNCFLYNGTESPVGSMGKALQEVFERQLKQLPDAEQPAAAPVKKSKQKSASTAPPRTRRNSSVSSTSASVAASTAPKAASPAVLPEGKPRRRKNNSQMRFCSTVLKELYKRQYESFAFPFYQPVDPVACDCPDYFDVIKEPMDLSTIQSKLNKNEYSTLEEFESDILLMFNNCFTYNPPGTPVHVMGRQLENVFKEKWEARPKFDDATLVKQQEAETDALFDNGEEEEALMSEEEINGAKFAAVDKQISMLQDTLEAMKAKKMNRMRKPRRRDLTKEYGPITYAMQNELAERCNYLSAEQLSNVAEILREEMPWLRDTDEIEIDVGNMKPEVFHRIYRYVCKPDADSSEPASPVLMPTKPEKKKGRVLSETEQAEKIRRLQQQLDRFAGKTSPTSPESNNAANVSDSESDNESESSESA